jgi:hypothetical protein
MRIVKFSFVLLSLFLVACGEAEGPKSNQQANTTASPRPAQDLAVVDRPQKIKDQMAERGEQDSAAPTLMILEPKAGATVASSVVKVKLALAGDLKGYKPHMDAETKMGNHIHVILDNQPYEAYYNLGQEFELRNVADGDHTLRVFPSRPWHESYKNDGAYQMVKFTVKGGGADTAKPATANGQPMSNARSNANANAASTPEGKEMASSNAGAIDPARPLLTYSRPKGEYTMADAAGVMIDFWLTNAKLTGDGGTYRVSYSIDGAEPKFIDKWAPVWIGGWTAGSHTIKLELVDVSGNVVDNGGYNSTSRKITFK